MDVRVLERIMKDAQARRELLWLRAKEKDDDAEAASLERVDPNILRRLRNAGVDLDGPPDERPRERGGRFGRLYEECFDRHAARHRRRS